jgi:ABC-type glucose/galactose transport system permease subunit
VESRSNDSSHSSQSKYQCRFDVSFASVVLPVLLHSVHRHSYEPVMRHAPVFVAAVVVVVVAAAVGMSGPVIRRYCR